MTKLADVYARVNARDEGLCLICGRKAWDCAHILPKGRYPELRLEEKNIFCACRECHKKTETYKGRVVLLDLMFLKYGYTYEEEVYREYWDGREREERKRDKWDTCQESPING